MFYFKWTWLPIICCFLFITDRLNAQESKENIDAASSFITARADALEKFAWREKKVQQRLLRHLRRKEDKMLRRLAAKDSTAYYDYVNSHGLSYDSIAVLSEDTALMQRMANRKNAAIDSLKNVQRFIENQQSRLGALNGAEAIAGKAGVDLPAVPGNSQLNDLQGKLNGQQYLAGLISQRTASLQSLAESHGLKGLTGIQKDVYYAKEKIKNWKQLADDPDDAEAKALEYLQGTEGFDQFMKQDNGAFGGLGNNATAADLQRMGFQTKASVNNQLQQSLGSTLSNVQQQMAQQVQQFTDKLGGLGDKVKTVQNGVNQAKNAAAEAKQTVADAKAAKDGLLHAEKPSFHKNPERGKPFWQRLEWQYNFQTSRASVDGLKPAMLDLGASVGFKHTPRLSYGIGAGLSTGLGQNWQNIRFSYEGINVRAYADWKWIYGFSFQAGYELQLRPANRAYLSAGTEPGTTPNTNTASDNVWNNAFGGRQQVAYAGIMKRYRINSKWNGTFLVGYNFLWQQQDQRSPFLLRFGWGQ